jgi:hypothetical protein
MRKVNLRQYVIATIVPLLFIGYACRKHFVNHEDAAYQNTYKAFFDVAGVTNNAVLDIAANVKKQETQMHFVQPFSQRDGFIRWKDAMVITKEQQDIVLLPFAKQGATEITGYIQAQKLPNNIGYTYEFFRTKNLKNYDYVNKHNRLNGTLADIIINSFNYKLFNKTRFDIPHKNVLPTALLEQYGNTIDITKLKRVALTEQEYLNYQSKFRIAPIQGVCTGHYEWYAVYDNDALVDVIKVCVANVDDADNPGGGGGSSGGSTTTDPANYPYWWQYGGINNDPNNPLNVNGGYTNPYPANTNCGYQPVPATDPNGMQPVQPVATVYYGGDPNGWQQCDVQEVAYNPNIADNVIIDTSITNNFPCFVSMLDTISAFGNLNQRAQVALSQVFNVNRYIHLTLDLDTSLKGKLTSAYTKPTNSVPVGTNGDTLNFSVKIRLNPDMLNNSTKEYIVTTIVHEAMHAYIDYVFAQYNQGYLPQSDSIRIKNQFPIFWGHVDYIMKPSELQQHNLIALNWVQNIKQSLYAFTNNEINPAVKDSIYNALAWGGLGMTDIFKTRTDQCNIIAINAIAKDKNISAPFVLPTSAACRDTFNFSSRTLNLKNLCD